MKTTLLCAVACVAVVTGSSAFAADMAMQVVSDGSAVQWGPAPPVLPPGAQMVVLAGDPSKPGFVSLRAKLPAGYVIPPHTHPTDEHATILSGTAAFGMGDTVDAANQSTVGPGGYFIAQAGMHHYMVTKTEVIAQVDMIGPFDITYINPADDPRNKH